MKFQVTLGFVVVALFAAFLHLGVAEQQFETDRATGLIARASSPTEVSQASSGVSKDPTVAASKTAEEKEKEKKDKDKEAKKAKKAKAKAKKEKAAKAKKEKEAKAKAKAKKAKAKAKKEKAAKTKKDKESA